MVSVSRHYAEPDIDIHVRRHSCASIDLEQRGSCKSSIVPYMQYHVKHILREPHALSPCFAHMPCLHTLFTCFVYMLCIHAPYTCFIYMLYFTCFTYMLLCAHVMRFYFVHVSYVLAMVTCRKSLLCLRVVRVTFFVYIVILVTHDVAFTSSHINLFRNLFGTICCLACSSTEKNVRNWIWNKTNNIRSVMYDSI